MQLTGLERGEPDAVRVVDGGGGTGLLDPQRHERLLDELRRDGSVRIRDLVDVLGVSEVTVRRDVTELAKKGVVTRVHGGATLADPRPQAITGTGNARSTAPRFTAGLVVPSLNYYWPQIVDGVRGAAATSHGRIVLRGSSYDAMDDRRQIERLLDTVGVDGLILAPTTSGQEGRDLVLWLAGLDIPIVLVERTTPADLRTQQLEWAGTDHALGAGLAVRHLVEEGHGSIGLLTSRGSPTSEHIRRGWEMTCTELGLDTAHVPVFEVARANEPGWDAIADATLEACRTSGTTALLIHSDPEAMAFVQHCEDREVQVPDDIAIVAYDDEVASLAQPSLTAVRPPKRYIGRVAVELLAARLREGADRPVHRVLISPELIVRESSVVRKLAE